MDTFTTLAAWTGLLGGATGFIALYLQLRIYVLSKPRIKASIHLARSKNTGAELLEVSVINAGMSAMTINNVSMRFADGSHSTQSMYRPHDVMGPPFPFRLEGNSSASWTFARDSTLLAITQNELPHLVRGRVFLASGKELLTGVYEFTQ
jgi:hypothetical protein